MERLLYLIRNRNYPTSSSYIGYKKSLLGIGGNVGNVIQRFNRLFWFLKRSSFIRVIETSPILNNPPFGYLDQDDFHNALILIETKLTPKELLRYLLKIEDKFGRKRLFKDGPRTLDLDIIFYENMAINSDELIIPHPSWSKRESVIAPLLEMKKV